MSQTTRHNSSIVSLVRRRWVSLTLIVIAVVFMLQNRDPASVSLLWFSIDTQLWLVFAAVFASGVVAGGLSDRRRRK